jgi:hypothetical protein
MRIFCSHTFTLLIDHALRNPDCVDGIQWNGCSPLFPGSGRLQQHLGLYTRSAATSPAHLWYVRIKMSINPELIQYFDRRPGSNVCIFLFSDAPVTAARTRAGESTVRGQRRKRMVSTLLGQFEVGHHKAPAITALSYASTENKRLHSSFLRDQSPVERRPSSL